MSSKDARRFAEACTRASRYLASLTPENVREAAENLAPEFGVRPTDFIAAFDAVSVIAAAGERDPDIAAALHKISTLGAQMLAASLKRPSRQRVAASARPGTPVVARRAR